VVLCKSTYYHLCRSARSRRRALLIESMTADSSDSSKQLSSRTFSRRTLLRISAGYLVLKGGAFRAWSLPATAASGSMECLAGSPQSYPPLLERFIAKLDPAADDFPCEQYAVELEKVLATWSEALCTTPHNVEKIRAGLAHNLVASLRISETTPLRSTGSLRIERRFFRGPETTGVDSFLKHWEDYLSPLESVTLAELQIYGIRLAGQSPLRLETDLRCDLVGSGKNHAREQRVGSWSISWLKENDGVWLVERWKANPEIRSQLTGPGFTEITAACLAPSSPGLAQLVPGIDHWRTELDAACGIDVYGNHGIAVGDIDNSGFDSFYVCQPSGLPNRLYRNRGNGAFDDITERSGTGILDGTASALFVDFLNRGHQDLLVVRSGGPLLFVNNGNGHFEARPDAFQFAKTPQGTFTSAAVADYNRDGLLDIYLCVYSYYQGLDQYQFPSPYYDAQNGPPNFLFRNRGDGTFEDVTSASGVDQNNNRFSFAVAWCDYDNSGWPSIYVANDFGRKNLYRNNGDGTFTDVASAAGVEDYGPGMSTCWLDYDNDGRQDVYVANMWLNEGKRITASDAFLPQTDPAIRAIYQKHNAGNSLYRNAAKDSFEDKSKEAGVQMGRWSWSCAAWDFEHDGSSDLYVANGFVSGANHHDLLSFFWRQVAQRSAQPRGASGDYEMAWNAINELVRSDYSWSGYERNVFFANNGDGTFSDVSGVLGLDFRDDSRAFALSDFDHDGRLEFVLKNRTGPQLRILRNDLEGIGGSVAFRLRGHTSNRDAIGTSITIESGAAQQTKFVSAGSGFASQHTKELFFGLGSSAQAISIRVSWPNGAVARYQHIPVNHRVEIEEGSVTFRATPFASTGAHAGLKDGSLAPMPASTTVRTWLVAPLFAPDLKLTDLEGSSRLLQDSKGSPLLLSLLRLDCGASQEQLETIQNASAKLRGAGFAVIPAVLSAGGGETRVRNMAKSAGFPLLLADDHSIGAWNIQFRYLFDRRREMDPPVSFLLNPQGAVVRIYQGLVRPEEVMADWQSLPTAAEQLFAHAMPFPGPYFGNALKRDYFTYGIAFVEYGYVDAAQAAFRRVIESNPGYSAAWFNLGTIYLGKKMLPEATKSLREAVRLNPGDADAWNNLGMIAGQQERYDEALDDFLQAARANPNHALAVDNMMRVYRFQGRAPDAQKTLEELIARAPKNAGLHLALGMALVAQHQMPRARDELETAVRLQPDSSDAMNDLGAVLLQMGQPQAALGWFEKCRRITPDFDRPFINSAIIYNAGGQPAMARQVLEEFLARHPDNAEVRSALDKMGPK
jgi:tetratricopeptide (TPR) repeat protein